MHVNIDDLRLGVKRRREWPYLAGMIIFALSDLR
jgi:hypothetical protein